MTRALAVELGKSGITVNAIAPGWFATEMNAEAADDPRYCSVAFTSQCSRTLG